MTTPLIEVKKLTKHYPVTKGFLKRPVGSIGAVDGVSFGIRRARLLGLWVKAAVGRQLLAAVSFRRFGQVQDRLFLKEKKCLSIRGQDRKQ